MNAQPQQPPDLVTLVTGLEFRIGAVEREITRITQQIQSLDTSREINLKIQMLRDDLHRIEKEVARAKTEALEAKHQLVSLSDQLLKQERESQRRDAQHRESQLRVQLNAMKWAGGVIVSVLLLVLGAYLTHVLH